MLCAMKRCATQNHVQPANPRGDGAVESHPCAENAQGWGTLGHGLVRGDKDQNQGQRQSVCSTRAWGRTPQHFINVVGSVGVFRLRGCFASRSSHFAQDDNFMKWTGLMYAADERNPRDLIPWNPA